MWRNISELFDNSQKISLITPDGWFTEFGFCGKKEPGGWN